MGTHYDTDPDPDIETWKLGLAWLKDSTFQDNNTNYSTPNLLIQLDIDTDNDQHNQCFG